MVTHYREMALGRTDEMRLKDFYRSVPPTGGRTIGPKILQKKLDITDADFKWRREKLLEHKLVGTVQGGGIFRQPRDDDKNVEKFYYLPIMRELDLRWAESLGRQYHLRHRFLRVLDTSQGGARPDGKWARPDITLLGGKVLPYLPGKFLDVITFEVKWGLALEGLYEALAHRRRANYSYLICVCPESLPSPDVTTVAALTAEATRQGLGVILARQEDDHGLWRELVSPVRYAPDPQELHDFLETQCNRKGCLADLAAWIERSESELPAVTDRDLRRLHLSTPELEAAREIHKRLLERNGNLRRKELDDIAGQCMISRVRRVMKDARLVDLTQGGGTKLADSR